MYNNSTLIIETGEFNYNHWCIEIKNAIASVWELLPNTVTYELDDDNKLHITGKMYFTIDGQDRIMNMTFFNDNYDPTKCKVYLSLQTKGLALQVLMCLADAFRETETNIYLNGNDAKDNWWKIIKRNVK